MSFSKSRAHRRKKSLLEIPRWTSWSFHPFMGAAVCDWASKQPIRLANSPTCSFSFYSFPSSFLLIAIPSSDTIRYKHILLLYGSPLPFPILPPLMKCRDKNQFCTDKRANCGPALHPSFLNLYHAASLDHQSRIRGTTGCVNKQVKVEWGREAGEGEALTPLHSAIC